MILISINNKYLGPLKSCWYSDKILTVIVSKITQQSTGLFVLRVCFFQIIATLQLTGILDNNILMTEDTGGKLKGGRHSINLSMKE